MTKTITHLGGRRGAETPDLLSVIHAIFCQPSILRNLILRNGVMSARSETEVFCGHFSPSTQALDCRPGEPVALA